MKIIVCGAGSVGRSIVSYLVKGNNDIVVIDKNQRHLDEIAQEFDVLPVLGEASHPDILDRAGADAADMLLAVTDSDEVNMVACQVAHSLFQLPLKIARIDSNDFLDPLWETLYSDNHLPIDMIISPDIAIAEMILRTVKYAGSAGIIPVLQEKYTIVTLKINSESPLVKIPLMQLSRMTENLETTVINITRNGNSFIPEAYDAIEPEDEINILVKTENIDEAIRSFGMDKPLNERLVIFGGNSISRYIGQSIEHDDSIISCKIIEEDLAVARNLAKELSHVVVVQGELMSDLILEEADISHADVSIAVTTNDKDNLLASLLAAKSGAATAVSVVNTPSYNNLIFNIGDSILIDRSTVTISKMLREIRKVKLSNAYSISRGQGEVWEMKVNDDSLVNGKKIGEINLHKFSRIFAINRGNDIIFPNPSTEIIKDDVILLYVDSSAIKQVEKVLS